MNAHSDQRPQHPGRAVTEGHLPHSHGAGNYTPEVSPLDRFIHRNRLLQKQLKTERGGSLGSVGSPVTVHNPYNPHMNPHPFQGPQSPDRNQANDSGVSSPPDHVSNDRFVEAPRPEDRPISSYPRFSVATSDGGSVGDRDSLVSDRDSTIMSGFFFGQNSEPPNVQQSARIPQQQFGAGRDSIKPILGHASDRDSIGSQLNARTSLHDFNNARESLKPAMEHVVEEDYSSPTATGPPALGPAAIPSAPKTAVFPPSPMTPPESIERDRDDSRRGRRRAGTGDTGEASSRSRSQPPPRHRRPLPPRQDSIADDHGRPGPRGLQRPRPGSPGDQMRRSPSPSMQGARGPGPNGRMFSPSPNRSRSDRGPRGDPRHGRDDRRGPGQLSPSPSRQFSLNDRGPMNSPGGHPGIPPQGQRHRHPPPPRQGSGDDRRPPLQTSQQYVPFTYRKETSSPSSSQFGPPSRQGSAENGSFPPPSRVGSGNSGRLQPYRQGSGDSQSQYVPYRQNSDSEVRTRPARQNSADSERGRPIPRNSPSPQPPSSVLPMIASIRAVSPEPIDADGSNLGLQAASPKTNNPLGLPERSPSAASDAPSTHSIGGTLQRPSFNFSRPMGNHPSEEQNRPSIEIPSPNAEHLRYAEALPTPVSITDEPAGYNSDSPAPAVIYSRFVLPRGREPKRGDSVVFNDYFQVPTQDPGRNSPGLRAATPTNLRPPSPAKSPPKDSAQGDIQPKTPSSPRPPYLTPDGQQSSPGKSAPRSPRLPGTSAPNMTPEEHLHLGLDLHEKGKSAESTYHFRLAAHGGHPTGMLFYALACRHGWGMRPNQKEGVMWLKQVTQLASSQVVDDENGITNVAFIERQSRRAQFALSIYELGVSHLNGWGTEMDKGLALNCFEIAGKWGDPDALSEAGFCYANGVGCKKDLKKAAKFYRQAEAKGVNMVGNSWIWKDKYLDEEDRAAKIKKLGGVPDQAKKEGGGFFHRKKSVA